MEGSEHSSFKIHEIIEFANDKIEPDRTNAFVAVGGETSTSA